MICFFCGSSARFFSALRTTVSGDKLSVKICGECVDTSHLPRYSKEQVDNLKELENENVHI